MISLMISIKELKELLRDKRNIALNIILPFLVIILMAGMYGFINMPASSKTDYHIIVSANLDAKPMLYNLKNSLIIIEADSVEAIKRNILDGKSELGVYWDDSYKKVYFFEDQNQRNKAITLAKDSIAQIIMLLKANKNEVTPIVVETTEITKDNTYTYINYMAIICGYIVLLLVMRLNNANAFYLSTKEKQSHTIEVLRISPVKTVQLVLGKWLTNFISCLFITLVFFLMIFFGVYLVFTLAMKIDIALLPKLPALILGYALFAAIYSLLQLVFGFTAKTTKQAQLYLIYFPWILLLPLTIKFGMDLSHVSNIISKMNWITFIPVINIYNLIQMIFLADYNIISILIILSTNCLVAIFFIYYLIKLFDREQFTYFTE